MIGIERPQRLDRVAEQLDAHRLVRFRRIDVHDAAASRDLARRGDRVDAAVSRAQAVEQESLGSQNVAGAHRARAPRQTRRATAARSGARMPARAARRGRGARGARARARAPAPPRRAAECRCRDRRPGSETRRCPADPGRAVGAAATRSRCHDASAASSRTTRRIRRCARAWSTATAAAAAGPVNPLQAARPAVPVNARSSAPKTGAVTSAVISAESALMGSRPPPSRDCRGLGGIASARAGRRRSC